MISLVVDISMECSSKVSNSRHLIKIMMGTQDFVQIPCKWVGGSMPVATSASTGHIVQMAFYRNKYVESFGNIGTIMKQLSWKKPLCCLEETCKFFCGKNLGLNVQRYSCTFYRPLAYNARSKVGKVTKILMTKFSPSKQLPDISSPD